MTKTHFPTTQSPLFSPAEKKWVKGGGFVATVIAVAAIAFELYNLHTGGAFFHHHSFVDMTLIGAAGLGGMADLAILAWIAYQAYSRGKERQENELKRAKAAEHLELHKQAIINSARVKIKIPASEYEAIGIAAFLVKLREIEGGPYKLTFELDSGEAKAIDGEGNYTMIVSQEPAILAAKALNPYLTGLSKVANEARAGIALTQEQFDRIGLEAFQEVCKPFYSVEARSDSGKVTLKLSLDAKRLTHKDAVARMKNKWKITHDLPEEQATRDQVTSTRESRGPSK